MAIDLSKPLAWKKATPEQKNLLAGSTTKAASFGGFVRVRGGEYFFAPCLTFLKNQLGADLALSWWLSAVADGARERWLA